MHLLHSDFKTLVKGDEPHPGVFVKSAFGSIKLFEVVEKIKKRSLLFVQ